MSSSLFERPKPDEQSDQQPSVAPRQDYIVYIKQTKGGQTIMFCTQEPAPAAALAEAAEKNLPLFVPSEIITLAGAGQEAVDAAIRAKLVMPGSTITARKEQTA